MVSCLRIMGNGKLSTPEAYISSTAVTSGPVFDRHHFNDSPLGSCEGGTAEHIMLRFPGVKFHVSRGPRHWRCLNRAIANYSHAHNRLFSIWSLRRPPGSLAQHKSCSPGAKLRPTTVVPSMRRSRHRLIRAEVYANIQKLSDGE